MSQEKAFKPIIDAQTKVPEFSFRALLLGIILGLLFGVGNAYLALKVGTTVSASIPAAVLSMGILRLLFRKVSILENNLVQTIASVGEGLAAGVVFTVPALFLIGSPMSIWHIFVLGFLGGVLGVLFMIPMRRYIIVQEHGILPFPEGTACAEILSSAEKGIKQAILAGWGILAGAVYKFLCSGLYLWNEVMSYRFRMFQNAEISIDATPALLAVGYIIGPRISAYLFSGGVLAWWVLIPLIHFFGSSSGFISPGSVPVEQMTSDEIWSNYIRYIGAGAIAVGGLLSLTKIFPIVVKTLKIGFSELFQAPKKINVLRTDKDISLKWLIIGAIAIIFTLWFFPGLHLNFVTILILIVIGFFFVAVTSLTVGIIGSTSNPVSGMTITTLLITCLTFVALGWTERIYMIAALTMGVVANVAICLGATTSQDLKAGYIVGATPRNQQIAEIIGAVIPALAIGGTIYLLNKAYGFGTTTLPAPQATMMEMIVKGVMTHDIPFTLVMIGVILGLVMELIKIPVLPFAVGLYLPFSLTVSTMVGGVVAYISSKIARSSDDRQKGVILASGLVAGDALMGVFIALLAVLGVIPASKAGILPNSVGLIIFFLLGVMILKMSRSKRKH